MFQVYEGYSGKNKHWEKPCLYGDKETHQDAIEFAKGWIGDSFELPDLMIIGVRYYYCGPNYLVIACE